MSESMELFEDDETLSGFRLKRLEVFNWGTFDGASGRWNSAVRAAC